MDTRPDTRALFHLILLSLLTTRLGREENELSYLSLLTRTDVGQAVSQPESPIEYIKHTRAPVPDRERARFVTYECT